MNADERNGNIQTDITLVEAANGSTGIGLAYGCAALSDRLIVTMPESMAVGRRRLLKALVAAVTLTSAADGVNVAVRRAEKFVLRDPDS